MACEFSLTLAVKILHLTLVLKAMVRQIATSLACLPIHIVQML